MLLYLLVDWLSSLQIVLSLVKRGESVHQLVTLLVVTTLRLSPVLLYVLSMVVNVLWAVLSMRRLTLVLSWRIAQRVSCCDDFNHIICYDLIADNLTCPNVTGGSGGGICTSECNNNSDCERDLLCCSNGCGRICSESVEKCAVSVTITCVIICIRSIPWNYYFLFGAYFQCQKER